MVVKSCLFPIAVHLARGNPIALAPAVLASLYKDLSLFKKTIDDLKTMVKFPLEFEVNVQSPFYLVQVWVWERFKNLQPQPKLINNGDHVLLRWHKVKALKIDNVRFALDSAVDDFLWRPNVRFADKCGVFYPNDEFWICKKDLGKEMLSFVICLRVCELVGFESVEQYLPHRVAMQFGMDQDVPSYVPRFNATKAIAWKNYCRPISDKKLYFPPRFFEADVTTRYPKWWKKSVLGRDHFVMNIMKRKRGARSRKHQPHVGKTKRSSNDVGGPPGFPPNLVDTLNIGTFCDDGSNTKTRKVVDLYADVPYENTLPRKRPVSKDNTVLSIGCLEKDFNDANGSKEARMSSDRVYVSESQGESCSYAIRNKPSSSNKLIVVQHDLQFHSDKAAQAEAKESVEERERKEKDDEVMVSFEEQCLKNQEELARLARRQEEILRLMVLREKRDEELRQFLISVLRNQQPPPSSSS
ncbi:serine/threonine-protein phosphatase [Trifolium pratense]|uniref:Serine/threonine-protein phosphatase n=1 Tax=Trifolium pratense TaxID=57577 RepID=A0A2K3P0G1_TRIPR|nr:serine/threonine-protein phosphatase [Trifolium pratense]